MMRAHELADRFKAVQHHGSFYTARCPAHDDDRASLSFRDGNIAVILKCHAMCQVKDIVAKVGLNVSDLFFENGKPPERTVVATYPYCDEQGKLLYEVVRFHPKDFRQRRANGVWNLNGVRRVLYRLNEIQRQHTVWIVEGEKDADTIRSHGRCATTNVGGAGKWCQDYVDQLRTAGVVRAIVIADNDDAGLAHAEAVSRSCNKAGLRTKSIVLPHDGHKQDVTDFLQTRSFKELADIVFAAPWYGMCPHCGKAIT